MAKQPAIFREKQHTYRADTCEPVKSAAARGQLIQTALCRPPYPGRPLARGDLPGVATIGFWDASRDQDWRLDWHRNEGIELTFLETGSLVFSVGGRDYTLKPDDLTVTRPWQPHRVGEPHVTASRLHFLILDVGVRQPHQAWKWPSWLVLTRRDRDELTRCLRQSEQPVWHANGEIRRCFGRIARAVEVDRQGNQISRLATYLNELFVLLVDLFRHHEVELNASLSATTRTVELFLDDLRGNVENLALPWTVKSMAAQCSLGVTRFIHQCKQVTNMTPLQFLNHYRVEAAARLLTEKPQLSITEVAMKCGFSSSQYFAAVFRRHRGRTPREYRKSGNDECRNPNDERRTNVQIPMSKGNRSSP